MQVLRFSHDEKTALTVDENGKVEFWTPGTQKGRVFSNKNGQKAILTSDGGRTWEWYASKAQYCEYYQKWFGEFPYGSWCWGIRKCLATNTVEVVSLETEINPRGATECDRWEWECKSYVPQSVEADLVVS